LAYVFGIVEEYNFLLGDGTNKPLGLLVASAMGVNTGQNTTAASATAVTSDEIYDCYYDIKAQYRQNGRWMLSRSTLREVMQLKTGEGDYIWKPGIAAGQPGTLCGAPYHESEYMPAFSTGNAIMVFGDFSFYWICERLPFQIAVLKELYAATKQTGYIAIREVDGMPVVEEAFARLLLA
jgi:HK97 family phage major capsid protein